jgi:citrate lyase subunit beta/citryl-CoA lyase
MRGRPDGIIQPKIRCSADVVRLGHYLDAAEAAHALAPCSTRIVPVATETPQALFSMGTFRECGARLAGLTWGAEDLSAAVGAVTNKNAAGEWTAPYELARSLCLLAASAASVPAIDTLYADFRDLEGLRRACVAARCDGFTGKIAIHPAQVEIINECFTPGPDELSRARRIIADFAASPDSGTIALDGQMLDIPHLKQARSVLARIGAAKE